jgi:hypothetical protein
MEKIRVAPGQDAFSKLGHIWWITGFKYFGSWFAEDAETELGIPGSATALMDVPAEEH